MGRTKHPTWGWAFHQRHFCMVWMLNGGLKKQQRRRLAGFIREFYLHHCPRLHPKNSKTNIQTILLEMLALLIILSKLSLYLIISASVNKPMANKTHGSTEQRMFEPYYIMFVKKTIHRYSLINISLIFICIYKYIYLWHKLFVTDLWVIFAS